MIVPIDRPIVDARNIAEAECITISSSDFMIAHNNKAVVLLSTTAAPKTSSTTEAIADGVEIGQILRIIAATIGPGGFTLKDNANTKLRGDWYVLNPERWLDVVWDGSDWIETGRDDGINTMSGLCSHSEGSANTASGPYSHAEGVNNTAGGDCSHAEGSSTVASGDYSHAEGHRSVADQWSQYARAGGRFASDGDAQESQFVLRQAITHSTPLWQVIGINASGMGPIVPADTAWTFEAQVVGATVDIGQCFSYLLNGSVKRIGNTTTLNAVNVTVIYEDDTDFDCSVVVDDANDVLNISVKDSSWGGDTVRWVATLTLTQITFT